MRNNKNVYKMVYIALLVAQAMVVFKLEEFIPVPFPAIPGAKLGLANIFTMVALYTLRPGEAFGVVVLRSVLSMLISNNPGAFIYSFSGAMLSFVVMLLLKNTFGDRLSRIGVSVGGAFSHNLGQLLAAALMVAEPRILMYLPALTIIAVPTGFFIGMTANFMLEHMGKLGIMRELKR
ncbi:Heptaprenyl diphosphate synthase component I [anaerobic digester metagenome]